MLGKSKAFDGSYWVEHHRYVGYRGWIEVEQSPAEIRALLEKEGHYMQPWYADLNGLVAEQRNPFLATRPGGILLSEPSRRITPDMLQGFEARGISKTFISLWMSFSWNQAQAGTDLKDYSMNEEEFEVLPEALDQVTTARSAKRRVISVGTSGVRALESLAHPPQPCRRRTDLFIQPGFDFRFCDGMLTNLHNSMGTHVIMASAFGGAELVIEACRQAVERGYYFGIHGDSMLVLR